jgi:hypothetical protein
VTDPKPIEPIVFAGAEYARRVELAEILAKIEQIQAGVAALRAEVQRLTGGVCDADCGGE